MKQTNFIPKGEDQWVHSFGQMYFFFGMRSGVNYELFEFNVQHKCDQVIKKD